MPDVEPQTKAISQTQDDEEYENEVEDEVDEDEDDENGEAATCSALCTLGTSDPNADAGAACSAMKKECSQWASDPNADAGAACSAMKKECSQWEEFSSSNCCPKQLQLPMFLSKTYHMIDKCDSSIATWSENGDNFVVKHIEKFAGVVLPLYFKHSNFSSFARQLNFYGFRKLRSETILTAEVDPSSACYVRFYHENFQRDKPHLLSLIKRATKGDQQSKDDLDTLRSDISSLKDMLRSTVAEYDRKLAELSYEHNRRISSMNAEYDKLASLVQHALGVNVANLPSGSTASGTTYFINGTNLATSFLPQQHLAMAFPQVPSGANIVTVQSTQQPSANTDMLRSLSQAAVSLHNNESESSKPAKKRPITETNVKPKKKVAKAKSTGIEGKKTEKQDVVEAE